MNKEKLTSLQLLQALDQKLKTREIFFWIDGQDCYLLEWTLHYTNKIKIGDLTLTKENYFAKLIVEFEQLAKASKAREQFLNAKFSEISDVELIYELKKRTEHQTIKLSMYPHQERIYLEGKDMKCGLKTSLPIEIKGGSHV